MISYTSPVRVKKESGADTSERLFEAIVGQQMSANWKVVGDLSGRRVRLPSLP
jgi:hypothetical protein